MAYNEHLAERIRTVFQEKHVHNIEEKKMMGGLTFMVNDKMCIGIVKEELMVRLNPEHHAEALTHTGCRTMDFTSKPMKGYVFISPESIDNESDLAYWVQTALDYNIVAKSSKKAKKK
jgi:TfoX/Sxy family transcriptional regulator of competence genes